MTQENLVMDLAKLIRDQRSREELTREKVEIVSFRSVGKDIMAMIEHGDVAQQRRVLRNLVKILKFPSRERNRAYALIDQIVPQRFQQRKFHLPYMTLERRRSYRGFQQR